MKPIRIDRDKLRLEVRKLGNEYVFSMLDDAIELLPPAELHKVVKNYLDIERLRPDAEVATPPNVLTKVKRFEKASLAGEYYESFGVNSKNCTQRFAGTSAWIAEYLRLLERCVVNAKQSQPAEVRAAMDILFGLLNHIDQGRDDVIFFADEGGAWLDRGSRFLRLCARCIPGRKRPGFPWSKRRRASRRSGISRRGQPHFIHQLGHGGLADHR